uniref:CSON001499 protein n=1 Tax=Culicoides sonorensis TaxID=179676 RepID=A0A336LTZ8_CULSO
MRIIWIILVATAMIGVGYVSFLLSERFKSTPLATVVESTIYPVADIAYPAVTICNYNRVNWKRIDEVKQKYIPNASEITQQNFESYLTVLNRLEYGSFDEFVGIDDWDLTQLEHIDLLELYKDVAYQCEELFEDATCWWRNRYFNCCEKFVQQRCEYGLCLSFNSATNRDGYEIYQNTSNYPFRTSSAMDWSGLRVEFTVPQANFPPSMKSEDLGIMVIVGNPFEWPSFGYFIPAGTSTGVSIRPTYSYATENVKNLEVKERLCIFDHELHKKINNEEVMTLPLPLKKYYVGNCYSECRQRHMIKFCNCTIDFFYPTAIMNYQKPPPGNPFFNDDEEGITCNCWQECARVEYAVDVAPNMLSESDPGKIIFDVHYQRATIVKYRTDVVFGWMDLMDSVQ